MEEGTKNLVIYLLLLIEIKDDSCVYMFLFLILFFLTLLRCTALHCTSTARTRQGKARMVLMLGFVQC